MHLNSIWSALEKSSCSYGDYAYLLTAPDSELSCDFYINWRRI
jgi:hypothetical protein